MAGGWWLMLILCERKTLLAGWLTSQLNRVQVQQKIRHRVLPQGFVGGIKLGSVSSAEYGAVVCHACFLRQSLLRLLFQYNYF